MATTATTETSAIKAQTEDIWHCLRSLLAFDEMEIFPKIFQRELSGTDECVSGFYLRARGVVMALLKLDNIVHCDLQTSAGRTLLEVVTDAILVDLIPDAPKRIRAFGHYEILLSMKTLVESTNELKTMPMQLGSAQEFLKREGAIMREVADLWPNLDFRKRGVLKHWSQKDLRRRVKQASPHLNDLYLLSYKRLSWGVHGGLVHVLDLPPAFLASMSGISLAVSIQSFILLLNHLIERFQLEQQDSLIRNKLQFALELAGLDSEDEAGEQRLREKLGL